MTSIAKVLRWPLDVLPLLKKVLSKNDSGSEQKASWTSEFRLDAWKVTVSRAAETAREVADAGELEIMECKEHDGYFISLLLYSHFDGRSWQIYIYDSHFPRWRGHNLVLKKASHIRFRFTDDPVTDKLNNPSTYLTIESVKLR